MGARRKLKWEQIGQIFKTENGTKRKARRLISLNNEVKILVNGKAGMESYDGGAFPFFNHGRPRKSGTRRQAVPLINRCLHKVTRIGEVRSPFAFHARSFSRRPFSRIMDF